MKQNAERKKLYRLLGDLPDRNLPIVVQKINEEDKPTYILQRFVFQWNGIESVSGIFIKPKKTGKTKFPVILYNHSHGNNFSLGKYELIEGREYISDPPYAEQFAELGIAALAIDHWGFGERNGRTESEIFKHMLWHGQVLWGMMVFDSLRALDYLMTRDDVDANKIGTLGMSMGSTMAWWLSALDERIACCIDICCLTDFQSIIDTQNYDRHALYYYVPGLLKHFTTGKINGLIAPRPHLSVAGRYDRLTPLNGLLKIDEELKVVYKRHNAEQGWKLSIYDIGHFETAAMRAEIVNFLKSRLLSNSL